MEQKKKTWGNIRSAKSTNNVFWLIVGAIISGVITKSCNKIFPDDPIIIKEVSDTIKIIHKYDFDLNDDSITNIKLKLRMENLDLAEKYDDRIKAKLKHEEHYPNPIMLSSAIHESKGYRTANAAPYFSLDISPLEKETIDFTFNFINPNIISDIYCLSIKICKIENEKHIYVLDENYHVRQNQNVIRINNSLTKGKYEIRAGFYLSKDKNAQYPSFYNIRKIFEK